MERREGGCLSYVLLRATSCVNICRSRGFGSVPAPSLGDFPCRPGPQERNRTENTVRSLLLTQRCQPDVLTLHSCYLVRLVGFCRICRQVSSYFAVSVSVLTPVVALNNSVTLANSLNLPHLLGQISALDG